MKKIHNEKSRSDYFTFKPLSDGNRIEKRLCVQQTKVVRMRTHAYKRLNKFNKLTSIRVRESYNLFRPNNSLKTIGYDILNIVQPVPAYKVARFVKCCDIVKGRNQNLSSLKLENLYITLPDHGYHYYGAVFHNSLIMSLQLL